MAGVPLIIAHRGSSGTLPENTVPAFALAVEEQADFVEIDVWRSSDGEMVIMHDRTLDRTTNAASVFPGRIPWAIDSFTAAELGTLDAGGGEPVPTLAEVLAVLGPKTGLLAELKSPSRYPGLEDELLQVIGGLPNPVVVQSFDIAWMRGFRDVTSDVTLGLLYSAQPPEDELTEASNWAQQINVKHDAIDQGFVDRVHGLGMVTCPWTVDDEGRARELDALGVDGIITNNPAQIRAALHAAGPSH